MSHYSVKAAAINTYLLKRPDHHQAQYTEYHQEPNYMHHTSVSDLYSVPVQYYSLPMPRPPNAPASRLIMGTQSRPM